MHTRERVVGGQQQDGKRVGSRLLYNCCRRQRQRPARRLPPLSSLHALPQIFGLTWRGMRATDSARRVRLTARRQRVRLLLWRHTRLVWDTGARRLFCRRRGQGCLQTGREGGSKGHTHTHTQGLGAIHNHNTSARIQPGAASFLGKLAGVRACAHTRVARIMFC